MSEDLVEPKKDNSRDSIDKLKSTNAYLNNIIFNIPGCVYWKDQEGVYRGCNREFLDMTGLSSIDEVIGKTDYDLCWHAQAEILRENDAAILRSGKPKSLEENVTLADGKQLFYTVVKSPLKDADGSIIGILGTSLDITYRKNYEEKLAKAKQRAEIANAVKTEFIANMSHDIRTPITGMLGMAMILLNDSTNDGNKNNAKLLVTSIQRLLNLLNEVMEFVQSESDNFSPKSCHFNLIRIANNVIELFSPAAIKKNIQLKMQCAENIPLYYYGNSVYIHRILLNLVSNAIKFTEQGSIVVSIVLLNKKNSDAELEISVKDTGIGIPHDKQKIIFERFSRLTPSYQGIYEGAGLGLSIVKNYIEKMNGEVFVESVEGKGSTFKCIIPLVISQASDVKNVDEINEKLSKEDIEASVARTENTILNEGENIKVSEGLTRILLVEDNHIAAKIAKNMLESLDCKVDVAPTGEKAVNLVVEKNYDLIFMDIGLPDTDGITVTKRIRKLNDPEKADVPIIALTGHAGGSNKTLCFEAGMNDVMVKPMLPAQAQKVIKNLKEQEKSVIEDFDHKKTSDLVIDLELGAQVVGSEEEVKQMLQMLITSLPDEKIAICKAFELQTIKELKYHVHKLRGGLVYCGVPRLLKAACELEDVIIGSQENIKNLYEKFLNEIEEFTSEYEKMISNKDR